LYHKILKAKPIIFFDKNNHSSLYQAAFLSGAELIRFPHNNMQLLSELLNKSKLDNRPKFIVTETLFGMDGDILPIQEVKTLAKKYNAFLYLDEAHSTGILGSKGYGLSTEVDLSGIPHLIMGTFSKALGSSGAYVAGNKAIIDYIINKAPGFIYSTANSPANISASYKAWQLLPSLAQERKKILSLGDYLRKALDSIELKCGNSNSHIVPIIIGNEGKVLELKKKLLEQKIIVSAIRPPTVPPNNSSIRIALNSCHNKSDIDKLIKCLRNENNISI
jgi:8-amino-7-oxononanoate synthase